jgi:hypothetical protein
MATHMPEIASSYKVTYHREKLEAYLRNERILPATLELELWNRQDLARHDTFHALMIEEHSDSRSRDRPSSFLVER